VDTTYIEVEALVGVWVRTTGPNLQLCAILVHALDNVKTLVVVNNDSAVLEDPFLVGSAGTFANDDLRSISIICGSETHSARQSGLNKKLPYETRETLSN